MTIGRLHSIHAQRNNDVFSVASAVESDTEGGCDVGGGQSRRGPPRCQSDVPSSHRQPARLPPRRQCTINTTFLNTFAPVIAYPNRCMLAKRANPQLKQAI